jgi:hypothetical protein
MLKRILLVAALVLTVSGAAMVPGTAGAQSLYVGSGVALAPNEPDFTQNAVVTPMVGFDFPQLWRVSFMSTDSKDTKFNPDAKMHVNLIGVQKLFVYPMNASFDLVGALGAGWYMVNLDGPSSFKGTGSGLGLMADGGIRYHISKQLFVDASFQYRDSGIQISSTGRDFTVDPGWTGLAGAVGWTF